MTAIIKPLRPLQGAGHTQPVVGWEGPFEAHPQLRAMGYPCEVWMHPKFSPNFGLSVISAVEVAKDADGIERGPEYHISVALQTAMGPARCPADLAVQVLAAFGGLDGWEEDNHVDKGIARNFWRPVAEPMIGLVCACKDTEAVVVEGDYEYRPLPDTESGVARPE